MKDTGKSPFTRYRDGYIDGYNGHPIKMPDDPDYTRGYSDGKEADLAGDDSKF